MIPKIIHYCWFGGNEKPEIIKKCIESWKLKCPDYEIMEWNESNFDISINRYMKEAYDNKKWGFVPDYARVWIIYNYGGIYMDTDVEILQSFDSLLDYRMFSFFQTELHIALGLGFGAEKGNSVIKAVMDGYNNKTFIKENGKIDTLPSPAINMEEIKKTLPQLIPNGKDQYIDNMAFLSTGRYNRIMYHYGTASWTDNPNWSLDKRGEWKDTRLKRFLRKPDRVAFIKKHFGKRIYDAYVFLSYDFLEYGLSYYFNKIVKRKKK